MTDRRARLGLAALGGVLGLLAIALAVWLPQEPANIDKSKWRRVVLVCICAAERATSWLVNDGSE